ncbi:hypothetical protein DL93DRAFT_2076249 [Clavulina sp. PMI_390]|nr:hypothetical protein DL93DRAFT_2076249 [Clavulina sp. PMI_390]
MEHQPLFEALTTALNSLDSAFKSRVDDITPLGLIHPRAVRADREDQLRNRYTTLGLQHLQLCQLEEKLRKLRVFVFRQQTLCTDALAAVSMLPQEVLCHIFRYVSQLDPASVHKIARVNREWRKAVHNDPKLWQGITIYGDRLNRLGNAIMRSPLSYTPFSLRIADPGELIIPPNLVLALQSRLRKVEFLSSNSAAIMEALNRQVDDSEEGLSALESLTIDIPKTCSTCHVDDSRRAISQMALTGIRMPRLTSLNLRRCWVNLPSTLTMQHLTVLEAFESDRQLRNLLVSCPNLVSLRVRGLRARDSSMHHIERIVLPQLRTLEVSAASRYAAHVLWQFSAPNLREFALVNAKVRSAAFAQDFEDHEFGGDSGLLEQFRVLVSETLIASYHRKLTHYFSFRH